MALAPTRSLSPTAPSAVAVALVTGLLGGALTQVGQGALPDGLAPLANSAAPWVLLAAATAWLATSARSAATCGLLCLAALETGYVAVARLDGFPSTTARAVFWLMAAVVLGPPIGAAAHAVRTRAPGWAPLGGGLLAGMVAGEGLACWLTVRSTTPDGYWLLQGVTGALLLGLAGRRTRSPLVLLGFAAGVGLLLATRAPALLGG